MRDRKSIRRLLASLGVLASAFVLMCVTKSETIVASDQALSLSSTDGNSALALKERVKKRTDVHEFPLSGERHSVATKSPVARIRAAIDVGANSSAALRGRLVDQIGLPIVGGELQLSPFTTKLTRRLREMTDHELWGARGDRAAETAQMARSGADGLFEFDRVSPGEYELRALAKGYDRVVIAPLAVHRDRRELVTVRLGAGSTLAGIVTDENDTPIGGASLYFWRAKAQPTPNALLKAAPVAETDADGSFAVEGISDGVEVSLVVTSPGHVSRLIRVDLDAGLEHIRLESAGHLGGAVTGPGGDPVNGAYVSLVPTREIAANPIFSSECVTGNDGAFRLDDLPRGSYLLSVRSWAGVSDPQPVDITADTPPCAVALDAPLSLTVRVLREDGSPVAGAEVGVEPSKATDCAPAIGAQLPSHLKRATEIDGSASFHGLDDGRWRVSAHKDGSAPREVLATLAAANRELEIILRESGSILLSVIDAFGDPVPQSSVHLRRPDDVMFSERRESDSTGTIAWDGLGEGRYTIEHDPSWLGRALGEGAHPAHEPSTTSVDVSAGAVTTARLELVREAFVNVNVTRAGSPVEGAEVMLVERSHWTEIAWRAETRTGLSQTSESGSVLLPPVLPGLYALCVRASSGGLLNVFDVNVAPGHQQSHVELSGSRVQGLVLNDDLEPLLGAEVRLVPREFAGFGRGALSMEDESGEKPFTWSPGQTVVMTTANGTFEFLDVEEGLYDLEVEAPGHARWFTDKLELRGSSVELDTIQLSSACTIRGQVLGRDESSGDTPGFVSLHTEHGEHVSASLLHADDRFELVEIPAGRYRLVATLNGSPAPGELFDVACGSITVQDLDLR